MRLLTTLFTLGGLMALSAGAAIINGSGAFTGPTSPNRDNTPFWDRNSSDGTNCNVGLFLVGGFGPCGSARAGSNGAAGAGLNLGSANIESYAGPGGVQTAFNLSAGSYLFTYRGSFTAAAPTQVGYYLLSGGPDVPMFTGASVVGNTFSLTAPGAFGLYYLVGGNTYRSNGETALGVAAFRNTNGTNFYFGFEDSPTGDRDFNDSILSVAASPEPGGYLLLGSALMLLGLTARRHRRDRR